MVFSKEKYKVTGLVALSDYSALFSNNTDLMFDAVLFGVAIVTDEQFDAIDKNTFYDYAGNTIMNLQMKKTKRRNRTS